MENIHPTHTGGIKRQYKIFSDKAPDEIDENNYFQCYQCGYWNDKSIISVGDSEDALENERIRTTMSTPSGNVTFTERDETRRGGCRFCGSHNSIGANVNKFDEKKTPTSYRG